MKKKKDCNRLKVILVEGCCTLKIETVPLPLGVALYIVVLVLVFRRSVVPVFQRFTVPAHRRARDRFPCQLGISCSCADEAKQRWRRKYAIFSFFREMHEISSSLGEIFRVVNMTTGSTQVELSLGVTVE